MFSALHEKRWARCWFKMSRDARICSQMAELLGARRSHARYSSDVKIDGLVDIRLRISEKKIKVKTVLYHHYS
jgi:hypothetical protein